MELRHLRYFVGVAETGNLSRAAQKLFIAQPPLSQQIRQLEEELGTTLFTRHPKGMRLTPAGESLLPEARALLAQASRLADVAGRAGRSGGATSGGTLAVGYVPSASSTVIPALVRRLRRSHPALELRLHEMISDEQHEALVAGHLDAGIARSPARHARLAAACSLPDPFCLALPAEAPRRAGTLDLRAYAEFPFVAFTRHRGPAYFDQSIHLCTQAGFSPRIRYEASTVHGVLDLVGAGLGVALVPASTALLAPRGVRMHALRHHGSGELLALLRRKADANPLLALLEEAVGPIFAALEQRVASALC